MRKFLTVWWRKIRAWLDWALGRTRYGHQPRGKVRVRGPDGEAMGDSEGALVYVSRHGLLGSGVTCPECGRLAARPASWDSIVQTSWGEAVLCTCGRMLLASPDDDIDPVSPKAWYDPEIFHKFERAAVMEVPKRRTLSTTPVAGDWVVVDDGNSELDGGEGRVISITGADAVISLSEGISGSTCGEKHATVPLSTLRIVIFDTLRKGDTVRILRGPSEGSTGTVNAFKAGMINVQVGDTTLQVAVERLEKIYPGASNG